MMIVFVPVLVMLVGILLWALAPATSPKLQEAGRLMFFCGVLVLTWRAPSGAALLH